jgi:opacity protein-like surface antigen
MEMKMKKLALVLIGSAAAAGIAKANHPLSTGFFVGANGGYGATTAKYSTTNANGNSLTGSTDVGGNTGSIGIMGGYGWIEKCLYMGAEVAYTFENAKINNTLITNTNQGGSQLKRNGYFNLAFRGGYLLAPNIMVYIRLGGNWSKWTFRDAGTLGNGFTQATAGTGSKNRLTFAPGVGLETAIHKHVYTRLEYIYEFGSNVRAASNNSRAFSTIGTIRNQVAKLGLVYKF